jgi:hypothetical protein
MSQLPKSVLDTIKRKYDPTDAAKLELERGQMFRSICSEIATVNGGEVDLGKALSIYFNLDKNFAEELSWVRKSKGDDTFERAFEANTANQVYTRAAQPVDADSHNGGDDMSDQLVENSIMSRIEADSAILTMVKTKILTGYKTYKQPKYDSGTYAATYKTKGAALDDFSDDTTGGVQGLDQIVIEAEKIGHTMDFEAESFVKLNAAFASDLIDIMTKLYLRGVKNGLYLGNASAPNPQGMFTSATTVTWGTSTANTIQRMLAAVGDAGRSSEGYFLVTNISGASQIAFEKLNNDAFNVNINLGKPGLAGTVMGLPLIIDNSFVASGSSPAKAAPLYLGTKNHYIHVIAGQPVVETDKYQNFKTGLQTVRIMGFNGGKPLFNDSFAKTTIPNVF